MTEGDRRKGAIRLAGRQGARVSESARLSAQSTIRAALAKLGKGGS